MTCDRQNSLRQDLCGRPPALENGSAEGLIALVESWMQDDADEQRETLACLIRGLDENRPPGQKLFPKELKGKTW